jgi:hypothetical protein
MFATDRVESARVVFVTDEKGVVVESALEDVHAQQCLELWTRDPPSQGYVFVCGGEMGTCVAEQG